MQTHSDRCPRANVPDDPAFSPKFAPKFLCESTWHLHVKKLILNGFIVLYGAFQGAKRVFSLSSGTGGLEPGWLVSGPGELTGVRAMPILRRFPARERAGRAGIAEARRGADDARSRHRPPALGSRAEDRAGGQPATTIGAASPLPSSPIAQESH